MLRLSFYSLQPLLNRAGRRGERTPDRLRLIAFGGAAALPIVIFAIAMIVLFGREQQKPVEQMLRHSAASALAAVDRELSNQVAALEALAADPDIDTGDWAGVYAHMRRVLDGRPDWITLRLSDARTHRQILNLLDPLGVTLPTVLDPEAIDQVVAIRRPLIGPVRSPEAGTTEPFVILRVPVLRDGAVPYTLSAAVRARAFSEVLLEQGVPEGWIVGVLDRARHIVGRSRRHREFVGSAATPSLVAEIEKGNDGFFFATTKDGEEVYTAFARSPFSGWTVAVGAPKDPVAAPLRRSLWAVAGGGALALGLAVVLGGFFYRALAGRQRAERHLAMLEAERAAERRLSEIAANFPGLIYRRVLHPDGTVRYPYVSEGVGGLLGLSAAEALEPNAIEDLARRSLTQEDRARWREALATSAKTLAPYSLEVRFAHPSGGARWLRATASAHRGDGGTVVWDGVVLDVTDRVAAEEALRRSEAELRHAQAIARLGHWTWRPDSDGGWGAGVSEYSPAGAAIFGVPPAELAISNTQYLLRFVHPEDRAAVRKVFKDLGRRAEDRSAREYRIIRADGAVRWVHEIAENVRDGAGRLLHTQGTVQDITERKEFEEHQRVLMAELNHRVKNTLAVVQAIAAQTARRAASPKDFAESFSGRLQALAAAHGLLTESNWRATQLDVLVRRALKAHGAGGRAVSCDGPDLDLSPKQTLALGLVLHELATNAVKHGALSRPDGRLEVAWVIEGHTENRLRLDWVERGGPSATTPASEGFGTKLIRQAVTYDLDGRADLRYEPEGLRCTVTFPWRDAPVAIRA